MSRYGPIVIAVLLAIAGLGIGVAPLTAAQSDMTTLTVSVATASGTPVGNVDVSAEWDGGSASATTASNGKAFVDVPRGADVDLEVDHTVYTRNHPVSVDDASEREVPVTVYRKSTATVTVVDDNGPIADARVTFSKRDRVAAESRTDEDGRVESGVIEEGQYTVSVLKSGYLRTQVDVAVSGDTTEEIPIERGYVTVEFAVFDPQFDSPHYLANATIRGSEIGSVRTQANGIQRVSLPVNSEVTATVEKTGYETVSERIVITELDKRVNISTIRTPAVSVDALNERVVVGERLHLTISDEYGDPIGNATVYHDDRGVGTPDEDGVMLLQIDEPGEHQIHAEAGGVVSDPLSIEAVEPGLASTEGMDDDAGQAPQEASVAIDGPWFVGRGLITDQGIHPTSAGVGIGVGIVLTLLSVGYARIGR